KKTNKILLSIVIAIILAVILFFVFKHDYALLQKNKEAAAKKTYEAAEEDVYTHVERKGEPQDLGRSQAEEYNEFLNTYISALLDIKKDSINTKITAHDFANLACRMHSDYPIKNYVESEAVKAKALSIFESTNTSEIYERLPVTKNLSISKIYSVVSDDNNEHEEKKYYIWQFVKLNKDIITRNQPLYNKNDVIDTYLLKLSIVNYNDYKIHSLNKL
ncbi:MAG: hypothetical protein RSB51_05165, partial [Clostridia bacterium]